MQDVTFLCLDFGVGGAQRHTVELSRALRKKADLAVRLVGIGRTREFTMLDEEDLPHFVHLDRHGAGVAGMFSSLFAELRTNPARVVVGVNQAAATATWIAKAVGPHRGSTATIFHTTNLRSWSEIRAQLIHNFTMSRLDRLIFVSANQRRHWARSGLASPGSETILNGVDIDRFDGARLRHRSEVRSRLGFSDDDVVIGLCAKFRPEKNHAQLIDTIAALRARGRRAKALFVGTGPTEDFCRQVARTLELEGDCVFVGEQMNVPPYLAAMDVGVLCSTAVETLSLSALEMMAVGLPLVLSDIGGASEIVDDGRNGFLFAVGDTDALTERLEIIVADAALRRKMGNVSHDVVRKKFSYGQMVDSYADLFAGLIKDAA